MANLPSDMLAEIRRLKHIAHAINDRLKEANEKIADFGGDMSMFGADATWLAFENELGERIKR